MSTQEQVGEYTGSFIPAHVMLDPELTPIEKMLYATIASWRICFASNEFLAERLGLSKSSINQYIIRLKKKGYVEKVSFDGRQRVMRVIYNAPKPQQRSLSRSRHAEYQDLDTIDKSLNPNPTDSAADAAITTKKKETTPPKEKKDSVIYSLLWRVIKMYALPVMNANHVRKWAVDLEGLGDSEGYLNLLLVDDLRTCAGDFRPTLNTAFDVVNKKLKIQRFYSSLGGRSEPDPDDDGLTQAQREVKLAEALEKEREWRRQNGLD